MDLNPAYVVANFELTKYVEGMAGEAIHGQGEIWKGDVKCLCERLRVLYNAYVVAKYELWLSMLWEKLAMVKDCVIVQIVNFLGGLHTNRGGRQGRIFVRDLYNAYLLWQI